QRAAHSAAPAPVAPPPSARRPLGNCRAPAARLRPPRPCCTASRASPGTARTAARCPSLTSRFGVVLVVGGPAVRPPGGSCALGQRGTAVSPGPPEQSGGA